MTDYFARAYCINLDRRADKLLDSFREFVKHDLRVHVYHAVDGNTVPYDGELKKGVIGCFMSHRNIIRMAKDLGLSSVLVLEDDVAFDDDLNTKYEAWESEVPKDWDMLYFGGNHNVREITRCSEHLMRATQTQTTHAYAVKSTAYDLILDRLSVMDKDVDVAYMDVQKQCNAYCFTPRLAWQRPSVSDIWNQHVDYSFIRDNDGCHKTMK